MTFRKILRDKLYNSINVLGLTIGITSSALLFIYVADELSYDRYHKNAENIYRVISHINEPDNAFTWPVTQTLLAAELKANYHSVKNTVRFFSVPSVLYKNGKKEFLGEKFFKADATVFNIFSYPFLIGDSTTALDNPFSIVLTEKIAIKYFGDIQSALGQSLQNPNGEEFKVTGVMKNGPLNSHLLFDALISNTSPDQGDWGSFGAYTYILLPKEYSTSLNRSLNKIVKEKVAPILGQYGMQLKYELQPITDIHLYSKIQSELEASGDISHIYIFSIIALILVIIPCINYVNLVTARSITRAKEIGIRKILGSQRRLIIGQSLVETFILALAALIVSIAFIYALLPQFNTLANKQFFIDSIFEPYIIWWIVGTIAFVTIVGGGYPALYLSNFNPLAILKGKLNISRGSILLRRALVISQFTISIFMLVSTFVVYDQLQYIKNKKLGFDKEDVIRLTLDSDEMFRDGQALIEKLKQIPNTLVGTANSSPGQRLGKTIFTVENNDGAMADRTVNYFNADYDFIKTLGMKIIEGRDFSRDVISDTDIAVLVNEAMVKRMGWDQPLGKKIISKATSGGVDLKRIVVGVMQDYHQSSLYNVIEPLLITFSKRNNFVFVHVAGETRRSLKSVEKGWKDVFPNNTFEYNFLDQDYNSNYKADEKRSEIFAIFSMLSILITCLGLFGLTALKTEQRTKEIGVRKVIGASPSNLIFLISKEFIILVVIGSIIAIPTAWYSATKWLQKFAYKVTLQDEWLTFIISIALTFMIVLITIWYHVLRAASANPVDALRSE